MSRLESMIDELHASVIQDVETVTSDAERHRTVGRQRWAAPPDGLPDAGHSADDPGSHPAGR
jgi:hypothetical protein